MNDCVECHTVSVATVGPSWIAVAERYKSLLRIEARNILIESVKKGSKGKWLTMKSAGGMPPLEERVSGADIDEFSGFYSVSESDIQ